MAALIDTLREEHRNIARLLGALDHQVEIFAQAGTPDYDVIVGIAEYFLEYPDLCHHPKEDIIFNRMKTEFPGQVPSVDNLLSEHVVIHGHTRRFRNTVNELLNGTDIGRSTIVDTARLFIEGERRHMQREEEFFFPLAEKMLTAADWSHIEGELAKRPDPLFGERVETRYKLLRERLLAWEQEYPSDRDL